MPASDLTPVHGHRLSLRLVVPEDAGYIHALRMDPRYNAHLSVVTGTVADQENWIRQYKAREAKGAEYYYVIERRDDSTKCGLVRLYDIAEDRFTWGSWILDANKPRKAALESAVLSFGIGFTRLGLTVADVDVRNDNTKARAFYERFGMRYLREDATDTFYEYTRARYETDLADHMRVITTSVTE